MNKGGGVYIYFFFSLKTPGDSNGTGGENKRGGKREQALFFLTAPLTTPAENEEKKYLCCYQHWLKDSMSPVCGIFTFD